MQKNNFKELNTYFNKYIEAIKLVVIPIVILLMANIVLRLFVYYTIPDNTQNIFSIIAWQTGVIKSTMEILFYGILVAPALYVAISEFRFSKELNEPLVKRNNDKSMVSSTDLNEQEKYQQIKDMESILNNEEVQEVQEVQDNLDLEYTNGFYGGPSELDSALPSNEDLNDYSGKEKSTINAKVVIPNSQNSDKKDNSLLIICHNESIEDIKNHKDANEFIEKFPKYQIKKLTGNLTVADINDIKSQNYKGILLVNPASNFELHVFKLIADEFLNIYI